MLKRKWFVILLSLVFIFFIGCVMAVATTNTPTVIFDGETNRFYFENVENDDLFTAFKELMPGDVRKQTISFKAKNLTRKTSFYLRGESDEIDKMTLMPLTIKVSQKGFLVEENSGENSLTENIELGNFVKNGETSLEIELTVPPTVGNEFANASAKIKWIFTAQCDGGGGYGPNIAPSNNDDSADSLLDKNSHYAYIVGYADGSVRPNANITRAEVATIFYRLLSDETRKQNLCKTNDFADLSEKEWFNAAVSTLANLKIVIGRDDGTFAPNDPITRAEFAAIASRFSNELAPPKSLFTDIEGHWAESLINKAAAKGWVKGYDDGTFLPNRYITRAEAVTLVNRVLEREPRSSNDLLPDMIKWTDNQDASAWYYLAVQEATNSHQHILLSDGFERWTKLISTPDWKVYEK